MGFELEAIRGGIGMEWNELLKFIETENSRLNEYYGNQIDSEKRVLARTVKLSEEVGELCEEVLAYCSLQRKQKLVDYDSQNLSHEFADVAITTLLLAKSMDVDIEKALEQKMERINQRYEKK